MRDQIKRFGVKTGLLLVSLTLSLGIGELVVRSSGLTPPARALLFSSETFHPDPNGAVRFLPNRTIRTVAVYEDEIEYDVSFHTNNLGFVDNEDYEYESAADKKYYAFVGDSFTAGFHGGEPWVPRLRKERNDPGTELYTLGVSGVSVAHFYRLLESVKEQLKITNIVVLAISNDFRRRTWYPLSSPSEIRFCHEGEDRATCSRRPPIAKVIPFTASTEDITKAAAQLARERRRPPATGLRERLKRSQLLVHGTRALRHLPGRDRDQDLSASFSALRKIREEFPEAEIHLIHLPEKQEVARGRYSLKEIGPRTRGLGIEYFPALERCEWSKAMFYPQDNHPNNLGYENIADCVSGHLFPNKGVESP